jgi:hypothetical protein
LKAKVIKRKGSEAIGTKREKKKKGCNCMAEDNYQQVSAAPACRRIPVEQIDII